MAMKTWWLYVTAVFLIAGTPGPNMLHVAVQSIRHGPRRTLPSMAGLMTAVLLCLLASAAGLGTLLRASPRLFDVLRYAGVAYLVWLGIKAWRTPTMPAQGTEGGSPGPRSARALYGAGLATGLSNPKLILFAAALFPQFLDAHRPFWTQLALLVASFVLIEGGWYLAYALGGRSLAAWLAPAGRRRVFDRVTGTLFIGFGAALFAAKV